MFKYIIFLFLATRLINLTLLPIFTDETNYIDWGFRATHAKGHLFYPLYDAKQPLVMWLFGLSQNIISDPLLAGRLVTVLFGLLTLLGLYKISSNLLVPIAYCLVPIFLFFDRQALMETPLSAIGVWSVFFLIRFLKNPLYRYSLPLGAILGLGFLIKSNSLLFIFSALSVITIAVIRDSKNRLALINHTILAITAAIMINLPMLTQPIFWKNIHLTTQYSPTISDISRLPFAFWWKIATGILDISFWQLTPPVFLLAVWGLVRHFKSHPNLSIYLLTPLILLIFTSKFMINRYVAPFLPLFLVFASIPLSSWLSSRRLILRISIIPFLAIPIIFDFLLIFFPIKYFYLLDKFTPSSYIGGYVTSEPSGYNSLEGIKYFQELARDQSLVIAMGLWSGNPEAAYLVYFRNHPKVTTVFLDSRMFGPEINDYECLSFPQPVYFVSREKSPGGLDKFFEPVTQITSPVNSTVTYVFKNKSPCDGEALSLSLQQN